MQTLQQQHYWTGTVAQDQSITFSLTVPAEAENLKLTLAWHDPAAQPNHQALALINDLDITLTQAATGQRWLPWTLSAYPRVDSLQAPPRRRADHRNNQEQISVQRPEPGPYTVQVSGHQVPQGPQPFYVAYQWDTADSFQWTYPTGSDALPLEDEPESILRWETTYSGTGVLDYSLDDGQTWSLLDGQIDLSQSFYRWARPDTLATALLRMKTKNQTYVSDIFLISSPLAPQVGFACADSVLLTWHRPPGAESYIVYQMGTAYLEPILTTTDTLVVLPNRPASPYYAVATQYQGFTSHHSNALDYTRQGLTCYLLGQYAELSEAGVQVSLVLGTVYQVDSVVLEKYNGSSFSPIQAVASPTATTILLEDTAATQGPNIYRTRLTLANGQTVIHPADTVIAPGNQPFLVYPNPVATQQYLRILPQPNVDAEGTFTLFTSTGQPVLEASSPFEATEVQVPALPSGIYLYRLTAGKHIQTGRIVVY